MNASAGMNNKLVFVTVILSKYFNHCVSVADGCVEDVELRNHQVITWSLAVLHGRKALGTSLNRLLSLAFVLLRIHPSVLR